jgi:hypothetical protein
VNCQRRAMRMNGCDEAVFSTTHRESEYSWKMKPTKARIDARFATAAETAEILGVPVSRMKELVRLVRTGSNGTASKHQRTLATQKRRDGCPATARKRHARGKVTKAGR